MGFAAWTMNHVRATKLRVCLYSTNSNKFSLLELDNNGRGHSGSRARVMRSFLGSSRPLRVAHRDNSPVFQALNLLWRQAQLAQYAVGVLA